MRLDLVGQARRALGTALAVGVIAGAGFGPASAQSPRPPRVTIARPATLAPLPPPPAARPRMLVGGGAYDVQRWLDRSDAPASLPSGARGTIVLARDLALSDRQYSLDTPLLVVVAESLPISGKVTIDVSARKAGTPAGALVLLARQITCDRGGSLRFISNGAGAQAGQAGGAGGDLTVAPSTAAGGV